MTIPTVETITRHDNPTEVVLGFYYKPGNPVHHTTVFTTYAAAKDFLLSDGWEQVSAKQYRSRNGTYVDLAATRVKGAS